jgi:hypothetical protein
MSYLFIKNSVSKRKICIIFIKNKKITKNPFLVGFFRCFFGVFWAGFFGRVFVLPTLGQGEALAVRAAGGEPRPPQDADGRERGVPGGAGAGRRPDAPGL